MTFAELQGAEPVAPTAVGDHRFKEDVPRLTIGDVDLAEHLRAMKMEWVLGLRAALETLDYSLLTIRYSERGRQAFHPRTMLGLVLYGIFVRHASLRDLERLTAVDVGAMWMCGGHRIDHSTIGNFVLLHEEAFGEEFFRGFTNWVVKKMKLRPGVSSIDGTVVESAGSHWKALRVEAARERARQTQARAQEAREDEALQEKAAAARALVQAVEERAARKEERGEDSSTVAVVPSDPEAVIQPRKDGAYRPSYKPSTLMHEEGVILGQVVFASSETAAVEPLMERHRELFGQAPKTLLLDGGFHTATVLESLVEENVDVLCPSGQAMGHNDWEKKGSKGLFAKSAFTFDQEHDHYVCPAGEVLHYRDRGRDRHGRKYRRYFSTACGGCPLRSKCTGSARGRTIRRYEGEEYKEAMALVLQQPRARDVYRRRMAIAEPVHAELRERFGLRRFRRRGLRGARCEFALYCIAFNMKRVLRDSAAPVFSVLAVRSSGSQLTAVICVIVPAWSPRPE
jgi:transposase